MNQSGQTAAIAIATIAMTSREANGRCAKPRRYRIHAHDITAQTPNPSSRGTMSRNGGPIRPRSAINPTHARSIPQNPRLAQIPMRPNRNTPSLGSANRTASSSS